MHHLFAVNSRALVDDAAVTNELPRICGTRRFIRSHQRIRGEASLYCSPQLRLDIRARLAKNVRRFREEKGWNQEHYADEAGIHRTYVSDIERGARYPTIAAQRLEMRFVEPKSAEQQGRAMLFRARARLVQQRTELVNMLRAFLYELGHVVPQGINNVPRIAAIITKPDSDLPEIARIECRDLLEQIEAMTVRIATSDRRIKELAGQADMARRLQTMPGVGPMTALAVEAFAPPIESFKCGRDFAAWLGLVPKQHSSGGKTPMAVSPKPSKATFASCLSWAQCRD